MSMPAQALNAVSTAESNSYSKVAIFLHWSIALLIFLNIGLGFFMGTFPKSNPWHDQVLFYHASFGTLIFLLAVARLAWRATHTPPALPSHIPSWQKTVAHGLHWVLYTLMLVVPMTGYMHRMAGGHPVSFFGIGYLPVLIGKDEPLRLLTDTLHVSLVWVLCILVAGHLAAALKHAFIDRDGVIQRMLRA
ncbi:cytochrome b [Bacillus sp. NP157]|nr:cytochrome b [Bacillus sp. NP157]